MNNLKVEFAIKGRYRLKRMRAGKIIQDTGWFDNLITNNGMNTITTAAGYSAYVSVGSSSTPPAFTDVAMGSRIATVSGGFGFASEALDTTNRYLIMTKSATFSAGAAAGTIAEIGVGGTTTGTNLFSRALVLDSGGLPTTVTVLSDEDLVVIYQLWIKQPTGDFTVTASGKTCTIRAAGVATSGANGWSRTGNRHYFAVSDSGAGNAKAYTGSIGAITGVPGGTASTVATTIAMQTYTDNSWVRECKFTFSTAQANQSNLSFLWQFGPTCWQMQMDSALVKTSSQTLRLGATITWSRDSGPA